MDRWGLCLGCVLGVVAFFILIATMRWLEGVLTWVGWGLFALFAWGAIMSISTFDRPAPSPPARPPLPRKLSGE